MDRRTFLGTLGASLLAAPLAAEGQHAGRVPRVGLLSWASSSDAYGQRSSDAFRQGLRELGYVEDQSIVLEYRWAGEKLDRLPDLAAELVNLKVDVIVGPGALVIKAVKEATKTIPVVMLAVNDPVSSGFVSSLAYPGGNITGMSLMASEVVGKQLELLRELTPKVSRVAILFNPTNPGTTSQLQEAKLAAQRLGLRLQLLEARTPSEIVKAFGLMTSERAGALIVLLDTLLIAQRKEIADLATKQRLLAVYGWRPHADAGGLMVYGANPFDMFRRAATYVDKILKGAKPGDLPVEQPTKFELVINLKTAKALGLTIPPSLLLRADEVIQ